MNCSIIIPFRRDSRHRERLFEVVKARWGAQFPDAQIIVGTDDGEPFSRARARNKAASEAYGDVLVFADADTVCNTEFLHQAAELAPHVSWVFPYRVYYNLGMMATDQVLRVLRGKMGADIARPEIYDCEYAIPSFGGIFFMTNENFHKIGGYDERFVGWGYEDNAFSIAADTILGAHHTIPNSWVAHLWHETPEAERFGQPSISENRRLYQRYEEVNGSKVGMRKVQGWRQFLSLD